MLGVDVGLTLGLVVDVGAGLVVACVDCALDVRPRAACAYEKVVEGAIMSEPDFEVTDDMMMKVNTRRQPEIGMPGVINRPRIS